MAAALVGTLEMKPSPVRFLEVIILHGLRTKNNNKIVIDKMAGSGVEYHIIPANKEKNTMITRRSFLSTTAAAVCTAAFGAPSRAKMPRLSVQMY